MRCCWKKNKCFIVAECVENKKTRGIKLTEDSRNAILNLYKSIFHI